ncbi:YhgE/Pip domain-containing protein [Ruminiclostridium cellobioparum]|uniref:YhgE/Pip-like protein n=1 Tax=Ruminiclostridium cellobioparum subsp. termitidis CT1112 TaxID=1195236 RepID=S0FNT1_RUMCE|nr:YhgE/Pip domain-containing protein [Ruminiclostridium cellobioparum]EMS73865.1 YhgE/Pip-like protein [Ruminiclostridium cellobioparum subsp. termitidis CT1112]
MQKLKKYKIVAVIIAVIIIPLVYSFFYLDAFWDPYSKLDYLPVAVVNQDSGATINGKEKNLGNEILDKLKDDKNLKWVVTDEADAKEGLDNRRYYASIYIPADFSKNISTAGDAEKIKGSLKYSVNEKRNYLASQVLSRVTLEFKDEISKEISQEIVGTIVDQIKDLPSSLQELDDGLKELNSGAGTIYQKTGELLDGQKNFNTGMKSLNDGLLDAAKGASQLALGADNLNSGAQQFYQTLSGGADKVSRLTNGTAQVASGLSAIQDNLAKLNSGTAELSQSTAKLSQGMTAYYNNMQTFAAGLDSYVESVNKAAGAQADMAALIVQYTRAHPEALKDQNIQTILKTLQASQSVPQQVKKAGETLSTSGKALAEGASQITQGAAALNSGISTVSSNLNLVSAGTAKINAAYGQINSGVSDVAAGMKTASEKSKELYEGTSKLKAGSTDLAAGISKASKGSMQLNGSTEKLYDGEKKLYDGMKELSSGISRAGQGVSDSLLDADSRLNGTDGLKEYISEPVELNEQRVNSIPDYGTAFTPYFVSLSLWVGALMMFFAIYLDPDVKFRRLNKNSKGFLRFAGYTLIGIAQALVLDITILNGLHLQVKSTGLFVLVSIIISLAFTSIMRFLLVQLRDVGKFIAILLLILQLTSCGGTFPMELVPDFFNIVNPFMPMTYSVNALKEAISGIDYGYLAQNLIVLGGITLAFLALNLIASKLRLGKILADTKEFDTAGGTDVPDNPCAEM